VENHGLTKRLIKIGDEFRKIKDGVESLKFLKAENNHDRYKIISHEAVIVGEYNTKRLREIVKDTTRRNMDEILIQAASAQEIKIGDANGILEIGNI
jgi:hypothetical protein